jgi:hypothetical protein
MNKKETFETSQALSLENSFGTIKQDNNVLLEVTVGINSEDYGWFEVSDIETGGDEWYAEGNLGFDGNQVIYYDGVFSLPVAVTNKLKEWGYDVSEVE